MTIFAHGYIIYNVKSKGNQKGRYIIRSVSPNFILTLKVYRTAII